MSYSADLDVRVTDTSLRDGSHAVAPVHGRARARIVAALDDAGVPVIEVSHGDGLGGSSFNYGFSSRRGPDRSRCGDRAAGQDRRPFAARDRHHGRHPRRPTSAPRSSGSRPTAPKPTSRSSTSWPVLGLETVGFLMMAHCQPPRCSPSRPDHGRRGRPVRLRRRLGRRADPDGVSDRVAALVAELGGEAQVGFHGHENLAWRRQHASGRPGRRHAGRRLHPAVRRRGRQHPTRRSPRSSSAGHQDGDRRARDLRRGRGSSPIMGAIARARPDVADMGYAGVYSSFLMHAEARRRSYGVSGAEILLEAGRSARRWPRRPDHPGNSGHGIP